MAKMSSGVNVPEDVEVEVNEEDAVEDDNISAFDSDDEDNFYSNCRLIEENDGMLTQLNMFVWNGLSDLKAKDAIARQLAACLQHNTLLTFLCFKAGPFMTERGEQALQRSIASLQLEDVRFYFATENADVQRILFQGLERVPSLRNIEWNSEHDIVGISSFPPFVHSVELNMRKRTCLADSAMNAALPRSFFESLATSKTQKAMRMTEWNWMSERSSICDFALTWRNVPSLSKLFLSKNFITDRSLTIMLEHWPLDQSPLKSLQLCHNAIAADGALLLVRAIANHPTLEFLTLDDNKSIGYAGLEMIGNELHTVARLRYFGLKRCATAPPPLPKPREVDDESNVTVPPEILAPSAARDNAATALLRGIEANCSLHHLCISDNGFVPQTEDKVCWYAALNQFGRHLLLAQNRVPATVWC